MTFDGAERFAQFLTGLFIGVAVVFVLTLLASAAVYVLQSLALYRMAKNAGFSSPILAWIPVASSYLLGLLCERASCRRDGKTWKFSVILPVLELLALLGTGSLRTMSFLSGTSFWDSSIPLSLRGLLGLVGTVVTALALYNLYWDYAQGREMLYTVLSVIFGGLGQSIILFILRDRVPISVQYPQYPQYQQYPEYPQYPQYPQDPRGPQDNNL